MKKEMTDTQTAIYQYISEFIRENSYAPSIREICKACHIASTSTAHTNINKLIDMGYMEKTDGSNRTLRIVDEEKQVFPTADEHAVMVPLVGQVAAGVPILADEMIEEYVPVPKFMAHGSGNFFLLKVRGDSMIEVGIYDGDRILVHQQSTANNGEIVVALLDDSATVKTYYKRSNYVELKPENSTMSPILVRDVQILGKVVGLYRSF